MKKIFLILKYGIQNSRVYVQAINLRWRPILRLSLIPILFMALNQTIQLQPVIQDFQSNLENAAQHVPEFKRIDQKLVLSDQAKALYYHSDYFQLIVDDQLVNLSDQEGIALAKSKADKVSNHSLTNLLLTKDQVLFYSLTNPQVVDLDPTYLPDSQTLVKLLNYLPQESFLINLTVFLTSFVLSFFVYWYLMALAGILIAILNFRLSVRLPFSSRLKLATIAGFTPFMGVQLMNLILPGVRINYYLYLLLVLFIIYQAIKNHTRFIQDMIEDLDGFVEYLDQQEDQDPSDRSSSK